MATLAEKIDQETAKLNDLIKKRTELDQKIKKTQETLEKYKLVKNNQKLIALEQATVGTGISVEDILDALQSGDFLALQERMEAGRTRT
jgi:Xaa-Pro aminopeptidase